ncbi:MAG: PorT family protein [Flavobacteriaceae bacterium]
MITIVGLGTANAQKFGATAGLHNLSIKASNSGVSASVDGTGFYAGFFGEFQINESFNIQPEIQFAVSYNDGDSAEQIVLPIMAKYYVSDKFNVQAGPQLDFALDSGPGLKALGIALGFGAGYDFSDKFFASGRYALGLNNRLDGATSGTTVKFNTIQVGLGYRF